MTKKKFKDLIRESDTFELLNNAAPVDSSVHAIDSELFGAIRQSDANRQSASPVSIFDIRSDAAQPRRAIPKKVRDMADWHGNLTDIGAVFMAWEELVNISREKVGQNKFRLNAYLNQRVVSDHVDIEQSDSHDLPTDISSLEQTLIELVELATSIHADGLANPITVVQNSGSDYVIETGERRWLAYHLLYLHFGDDKYAKIAARTVPQLNIWRQASENNARANLNAISKARQFAVLLMDLLQREADLLFTPHSSFEGNEQGYYAQVGDGKAYRIPKGSSERLLHATGLKSGKQLREYRALLRLPRLVWEIADDLNWTERAIRDLRNRSMNDADLEVLAIEKAEKEGYSVPMGTVSAKPAKKKAKKTSKNESQPTLETDERKYFSHFLKVLGRAKSGRKDARKQVLTELDKIREWLDEQEFQLSEE
ncbi:MAG: ParB N-terminal domain-containing protein [Anaerolineae bacterium]|nr:ParB N-terminal domain-containing protein [Anaerolineae bacterium]